MNMQRSKYFMRIFIFTLLMSLTPVIILGAVSFTISSDKLYKKELQNNIRILEQSKLTIESQIRSIESNLFQFMNSPYFFESLSLKLENKSYLEFSNLGTELRRLQTTCWGVSDICLVNLKQDWVVNTNSIMNLSVSKNRDQYLKYLNSTKLTMWEIDNSSLNALAPDKIDESGAVYLNIVKKPLENPKSERSYLLFARISIDDVKKQLSMRAGDTEGLYIINNSGRVVFASNMSDIGRDFSNMPYMEGIINSETSNGVIDSNISGEKYGVAFSKADYNGWYYISLIRNADIMKESNAIRNTTFTMISVIFIICLVAGFLYSRKLSIPFQRIIKSIMGEDSFNKNIDEAMYIGEHITRLMEDNKEKTGVIQTQTVRLSQMLTKRLYTGDIPHEEVRAAFYTMGIDPWWKWMAVMSVQIESLEATVYEEEDIRSLMLSILEMVEEQLPSKSVVCPVTSDGTLAMLVGEGQATSEAFKDYAISLGKILRNAVYDRLKLRIIIGISRIFNDVENISEAWFESQNIIKWNIISEGKGIYCSDDEDRGLEKEEGHQAEIIQLKREVLDALKMGDALATETYLSQYLKRISEAGTQPWEFQIWLTGLLSDCFQLLYEHPEMAGKESVSVKELTDLKTTSQIEAWFKTKVISRIIRVQKELNLKSAEVIKEAMLDLVHNHYEDDLSLNECAVRLNYHPNYLGKVFRKERGIAFSDYLAQYRLGVAKKWLEQTDIKVGDISKRLRYTHPQNFIRSFNKEVGITPGQYRERHNKNDLE